MRLIRLLGVLVALGLSVGGWAYWTAIADPVVREAVVALAGWPKGEPPITALLISDIHVAGPDMPPDRLVRIVAQINKLQPDIVLIAGDFISDKRTATRYYPMHEGVAPLAELKPRLGTFAVMGNHDHWRGTVEAHEALKAAGVRVLDNQAAVSGPLAIGGLDDAFTGQADLPATITAVRGLPGARILLRHSPDPFPNVPDDIGLMLAGHTHCGQIRLPIVGAIATMSDYGDRYVCGLIRENGRTLIVGAGVGTSILPLRLGAVPDMWLIRLGPVVALAK
ncbi:metallophosphoesterase [Chitinimonas sp. PSY-7]|uniref:metallophosphoesterase n=1 Tax=Chitinimonas sp. PSY-7 TaxID=3459088 RepID=UPI004040330F